MAGPYNPPNPYGSYFSFGNAQDAMDSSFSSSHMSPGSQGLMGRGQGGFNPTPSEYLISRIHSENMARYMRDVYKGDPRTASFTNLAMQAMFGADEKRKQAVANTLGGMGNLQELVGYAINQPGISGYLGGSAASLGVGAYSLAASGMGVNGRLMHGDGPLQQMMAKSIYGQIQSRFYTGAGASITGMTQGMNRDQIGGIMTMMASQGAFQGVELGKLIQDGAAGPKFKVDQTALNRITETVKSGAKALAAIVDVYGDSSVADLFSKANQITGLNFSSPGNAQLMAQRISQLRSAGTMMGIDTQTMFDSSKMGVTLATSLGLSGHMAAYAGSNSAVQTAFNLRASSAGRSIANGGFLLSGEELQRSNVRDIAGMANDPIGMRLSLMTLISAQSSNQGTRDEIRNLMDSAGIGGASEFMLDTRMARMGFQMPDLIRGFGGPDGINRQLTGAQSAEVQARFGTEMDSRAKYNIRNKMVAPRMGSATDSAMFLIENLKADNIQSLFEATGRNDNDSVMSLLKSSAAARRDPEAYKHAIASVISATGDAGVAAANMSLVQMMIPTDQIARRFLSYDQRSEAQQLANSKVPMLSQETRGFMKKNMMDGILDRYGGTDTRSAMARMMVSRAGDVAGGKFGLVLPNMGDELNLDKMAILATTMQKEFAGTQAGRDLLREMGLTDARGKNVTLNEVERTNLHNSLADPSSRARIFRNMTETRFMDSEGGARSMFAPTSAVENMQQYGGITDVFKALSQNMGGSALDRLIALGMAAEDPGHVVREVRGGRSGRGLRAMTNDETDARVRSTMRDVMTTDALQKMTSSDMTRLAKSNGMFGQMAADILAEKESNLMGTSGQDEVLASIKKMRGTLAAAGFVGKEGGNITKIMGTLKLVGDRELELVAKGSTTEGKK